MNTFGDVKKDTRSSRSHRSDANQIGHVPMAKAISNNEKTRPSKAGAAFSAMIKSMLPPESHEKKAATTTDNNDDVDDDASEYIYDEFGFKIVSCTDSAAAAPFVEDSKHKLKWIAYLEFTLNANVGLQFAWDEVTSLARCEKLKAMIKGQGVPHSLRQFVWMRLTGAWSKRTKSNIAYADIVRELEHEPAVAHSLQHKQIENDLLRTLPKHVCFSTQQSVGVPRLRRILRSLAMVYPHIGYCQGMGTIVAHLLLLLEEEDAFWMMCSIIEDILPASFYSHTLLGVKTDIRVLHQLVATYLPEIDNKLRVCDDIDLSLICINWFVTVFANVLDMRLLLRVWDIVFYEGSSGVFQIALSLFKLNERRILGAENSAHIFAILSDITADIGDIDCLVETSIRVASSVSNSQLDVMRKKQQCLLVKEMGESAALAHQHSMSYNHFQVSREKSIIRSIANDSEKNRVGLIRALSSFMAHHEDHNNNNNTNNTNTNNSSSMSNISHMGGGDDLKELKMKNIVQTEMLLNLRAIIVKIVDHFRTHDPHTYGAFDLSIDYSIDSHLRDYENYIDVSNRRLTKRAKALFNFDKNEEDELGFSKHDIITVLSTKDDHCWIGELDGRKGWFPSKFVTLIDERNGKTYSKAGDESVSEPLGELIRKEFFWTMKSIFEHGLKKWHVLGGSTHPWSFVEEAAAKIVEKDFESVYSRLVLCKTFRLDEDGKVLTPDELLFRSVKLINVSYDSTIKTRLDAKLRTLLCIGLNEQVLHIWLETLCSCLDTVEKWYHSWSFIRSPGWVQIKCELRLLARLSFLLNTDAEMTNEQKKSTAINDCIKDMIVKHHLFSWEI